MNRDAPRRRHKAMKSAYLNIVQRILRFRASSQKLQGQARLPNYVRWTGDLDVSENRRLPARGRLGEVKNSAGIRGLELIA